MGGDAGALRLRERVVEGVEVAADDVPARSALFSSVRGPSEAAAESSRTLTGPHSSDSPSDELHAALTPPSLPIRTSSHANRRHSDLARVDEHHELADRPAFPRAQSSPLTPTRRLIVKRSPKEDRSVPFPHDSTPTHRRTESDAGPRFESPPIRARHQSWQAGGLSSPLLIRETSRIVVREGDSPARTYQLGEVIGRGQFGIVYRALNTSTGRTVAVKRINIEDKTDVEVEELAAEVEVLKRLSHSSIVKYEGVVRTQRHLNIVLEYVENGSLHDTLKAFGGRFSESLAANYTIKILEGLQYLHQNGIAHCDLKAANVLTTKQGNIKLSDFGVSLNVATHSATVQGTPNWMAPEVVQLQGADTASDIWSLGALVIELVTGQPPYHDLISMSVLFRIVEDNLPPLPVDASTQLLDFLRCCFRKEALERPTAGALLAHPWLGKSWDLLTDIADQDSIPFLRRISKDVKRESWESSPDSPPLSPSAVLLNALASSTGPPMTRASVDIPRSSMPREHSFVKSNFARVIQCRLCFRPIKRKGLLCDGCGLVCHVDCQHDAPRLCDLRLSLMGAHSSSSQSDGHPSRGSSAPPLARSLPAQARQLLRIPDLTPTSSTSDEGASPLTPPVRPTDKKRLSWQQLSRSQRGGSRDDNRRERKDDEQCVVV